MNARHQYDALRQSAGFVSRTDKGRILLTGADRLSYLQGLLTNDIAALGPGSGCYAALLTPQGRMISDMRVLELGDRTLLVLELPVTAMVRDHLDKFVITEDVVVEDASGTWQQVTVAGPGAARAVEAALRGMANGGDSGQDADTLDRMTSHQNLRLGSAAEAPIVVRSDELGIAGFDVIVAAEEASRLEQALADAGVVRIDPGTAEVTRIEAGIPRFLKDMNDTTIPLEAGIEADAISMTKGCYVGQEVIVRVLHRGGGRVARKLVRLRADSGLAAGSRLLAGEKEVGTVTSAAESPRLGPIGLGYVQRDFAQPGTELRSSAGGKVQVA